MTAIEFTNKLCHTGCQIFCLFCCWCCFSVFLEGDDLEKITDGPAKAFHRTVAAIIHSEVLSGVF